MKSQIAVAITVILSGQASGVTLDWVAVADTDNVCEVQPPTIGPVTHPGGCFGAVSYQYEISKYEITNSQYAEFLNAVAAEDANSLYNANMGSGLGGITRNGSPGSYSYSTIVDRGNMPANYVSFFDALRFANWLHNGQPTGAQGGATTEDGAYDLSLGSSVTRGAGARIVLPTEDEWYKAAYWDALSQSYFDFPAGTDLQTLCALPGATPNAAHCDFSILSDVAEVGSYTQSTSPSGTFDQGGNVWEWNEAIIGGRRGVRGGAGNTTWVALAASNRRSGVATAEDNFGGFRVVRLTQAVPEPGAALLMLATLGALTGSGRGVRAVGHGPRPLP